MGKKKELEIKTLPFVTYVPENAIEIKIEAKILNDDGTTDIAETEMNFSEVREGFARGEEWEEENGVYALSDEFRKKLEEIERKDKNGNY